jgi:hypothetical protein
MTPKTKIIITISIFAILILTVLVGQTTIFAQEDEAPPGVDSPFDDGPPELDELPPDIDAPEDGEDDEGPPGVDSPEFSGDEDLPPGVDSPEFSEDDDEDSDSDGTGGIGGSLGGHNSNNGSDDDSNDDEEGSDDETDENGVSYMPEEGETIVSETGPEVGILLIPSLLGGYLYRRRIEKNIKK